VKQKLNRYNELEMFTNVFEGDCMYKGVWNKEFFKNEHPIIIELGCGRGEYTVEMASSSSNCNYIGVDIKGARLWRGAKTAYEAGMSNVAFLRVQIEGLCSFFASGELSEIWITFPDPQPSQRRMKKRLTSRRFLESYQLLLKPGGRIHLKTDSADFLNFSKTEILNFNGNVIYYNTNIYEAGLGSEKLNPSQGVVSLIQTSYEKRYLREGTHICYLMASLPAPPANEDR